MDDLTPTGTEVVQTGVSGLGSFFSQLGAIAVTGLSRRVDLEFAADRPTPDTAEINRLNEQSVSAPGFGSVIENLTPVQLGGLVIAAGLSFALATGKFKF